MSIALILVLGSLLPQTSQLQDPGYRLAHLPSLGDKPAQTHLDSDHDPRLLEIKFVDGSVVRLVGGHLLAESADVFAVDEYLESIGAARVRIFSQSDEWLTDFRLRGEARSGKPLHDMTLFYRVELAEAGQVASVCDALNAFASIQIAYPLGRVTDPVVATALAAPVLNTPDFEPMQGYRQAAPTGIDADYGNTFAGGTGLGVTIADVETGWTDDHEDIAHKAQGNFIGLSGAPYPHDHGTAVLGELVGEEDAAGVRGICYSSDILLSTHQGFSANIPAAVMNAVAAVSPGDMVLLEVQCFGGPPGPFPCEYVASTFASVSSATANGIHVVSAGGNGNLNLDSAVYGGLFDRTLRDSGAIMVGASNGVSLDKAAFSNYGTRMDAHGWGFNVVTAAYGDLQGGVPTKEYTATFSGTSSASPIVLGAANILNCINLSVHGAPLDPLPLRALLTSTGTPQGAGGQIGPRPNVRAAIAALNLPRIEVAGNFVPGGQITITSRGPVGAIYALTSSFNLRSTPWFSPFGEFFLANPWQRVTAGVIPASGAATYAHTIPNDQALSGTTYRYYQGWMRYAGTNGGSFSNYLPVDVQ